MRIHVQNLQVKSVHQGHRVKVKVKVTGAKQRTLFAYAMQFSTIQCMYPACSAGWQRAGAKTGVSYSRMV